MFNLLRSDLYKVYKSRAFYILTLLNIIVGMLMAMGLNAGMRAMGGPRAGVFDGMLGQINGADGLSMFIPFGFHLMFLAIFVSIYVASEFQNGTIKNVLSRGARREKVFLSKFVVSALVGLFMFFVFVGTLLLVSGFYFGFDISSTTSLSGLLNMLIFQSLFVVAYVALFTLVSMTIRGAGGAIGTNLVSVTMMSTILSAVSYFLPWSVNLNNYWIDWGISNLSGYRVSMEAMSHGLLLGLAWVVGCVCLGVVCFRRMDVK